ncbi:MAG TPA: hypothetical protein DD670_15340, partial [Planctomycetaceae bacterium]|nr:hypothetical protein [Planctomycetaceae bacterium]
MSRRKFAGWLSDRIFKETINRFLSRCPKDPSGRAARAGRMRSFTVETLEERWFLSAGPWGIQNFLASTVFEAPRNLDENLPVYRDEDRLGFDASESLSVIVGTLGDATATGTSYLVFEEWGGTWWDAEKTPANTEDDLMCWAAAASNILAWTGWGYADGMATADQIFAYFQNHWTDEGGLMQYGWDWWFDGTNPSQGWSGWSQVDVSGGDFHMSQDFYDYYRFQDNDSLAMSSISSFLRDGYGVTLGIYGPGGHAITCWGFNYNPANPSEYLGVWITDSDDSKGSNSPADRLRYYEVNYTNGQWFLEDYYSSNSWYIGAVQALATNPNTPAAPSAPNNEISGVVFVDANCDGVRNSGEAGQAGQNVFLDANGNGVLDQQRLNVASTNVAKAITDLKTTTSTLQVTGAAGVITDLNLSFDLSHTYTSDLTITLISPSGTRVLLCDSIGGSGDHFRNTTLDDEAAASVDRAAAPFTGTFRPMGSLADFDGESANGTWTLEIRDNWSGDQGTLNSWSLDLSAAEISTTTAADGSYSFTGLADGDYRVATVLAENWTHTLPTSGYHNVALVGNTTAASVNFGLTSAQATPGIRIIETNGSTAVSEDGATDQYQVVLTSRPTANVTVTLHANNQLQLNRSSLTFTSQNWNVPQTVTIGAVDDNTDEADVHTASITHTVTSTDPDYAGMTINGVTVSITDNDVTRLVLTTPNGGENWNVGSTVAVNWTSECDPGPSVMLALYKGGMFDRMIAASTPNDGQYLWAIPTDLESRSDYTVRITATSGVSEIGPSQSVSYWDESSGTFSITGGTILVTTLSDIVNANDGVLSLREAITVAAATPGNDVISFDAALFSGTSRTITLTGGPLKYLGNAPGGVDGVLIINGPGADLLTINGRGTSQLFQIAEATAEISGVTLTGGYTRANGGAIQLQSGFLTVADCVFTANRARGDGGAIASTGISSLTVINSDFVGNGASKSGGAVSAATGTIVVESCSFTRNAATHDGGAIRNASGSIRVSASTFTNNVAGKSGGALRNSAGTIVIADSSFSANQAKLDGGAVYNASGQVTASASTFANNSAGKNGGAIRNAGQTITLANCSLSGNQAKLEGGAVYNASGQINASDSTFTSNSAGRSGGAIRNAGQSVLLAGCSLTGNSARAAGGAVYITSGSINATSSTFANNTATKTGGAVFATTGTVTVRGCELLGNSAGLDGGAIRTTSGAITVIGSQLQGNQARRDGGAISSSSGTLIVVA